MSERTLRRLFEDALGLSWRTYLLHARLLRAMALLAAPGQSVQETSTAVGFDSLSSFTRAFTQFCGETPVDVPQKCCAANGSDACLNRSSTGGETVRRAAAY